MRFRGERQQGFPGMQGPGGMASPMNQMQKSQNMPGQQGPMQPPQQTPPQPQGMGQNPGMGGAQAMVDAKYGGIQDLSAARNALQRAQVMGADPMTILELQNKVNALEVQARGQMMRQERSFNDMTAGNSAPGIGGARPNTASPGYQAAAMNQGLDMQMLAQLFGFGGGPGPRRG